MNPVLLTKELDAFYHIFIDRFQKIENQISSNQLQTSNYIHIFSGEAESDLQNHNFGIDLLKNPNVVAQNLAKQAKDSKGKAATPKKEVPKQKPVVQQITGPQFIQLRQYHQQFKAILKQLRTEPSLKDLFPHLIHFIQSKNLLLLETKPACDALIFYLLLEATESVIENQFFNIDVRITDIVSVLLSIAL